MGLTKEQWEQLQNEERFHSEELSENKQEVCSSPFDKLVQKLDELTTQVNNNNVLINQLDTHVYFLTDLLNGLITSLINGEKLQDLKEYPDLDNLINKYEQYEQNRNHWD